MYRIIRIFWALSFVALAICLNSCAAGGDRTRSPKPLKTPAEQNDRPKIIAFGDSLTAGFGLTEKESYPYLLQEKLRADGFDYDVVNAGVSGDTTLGGLERIDWALENENVRILILELGANDLLRGIPPDKMRSNLDQIIRKTKAKGIRILLCGMLAPPTLGQQYQREFVNAFPDLATEHKLDFLPFLLEGVALNKDLNQPDGIHPNAEGSRIMTDNVYRALKPMLSK